MSREVRGFTKLEPALFLPHHHILSRLISTAIVVMFGRVGPIPSYKIAIGAADMDPNIILYTDPFFVIARFSENLLSM